MKLKSLLFLSLLLLTLTASAQTAEELNAKGEEYYNAGDYTKAVEYFQKSAEQGDASAQYNLGECYCNGDGVPQSYSEAAKWFCKSAEQGYAAAQCYLGWCYEKAKVFRKATAKR